MSWTDRSWTLDVAPGLFPALVERLRGTTPRARALVAGVDDAALSARPNGSWCAKEHIGHLDDLHALDVRRLDEFLAGADVLTAADMSNRRTFDAHHDARSIAEVLDTLEAHRASLVDRLDQLSESDVVRTAMHPRLRRTMRLVDWAMFVAEHDDHHLTRAREALRATARA